MDVCRLCPKERASTTSIASEKIITFSGLPASPSNPFRLRRLFRLLLLLLSLDSWRFFREQVGEWQQPLKGRSVVFGGLRPAVASPGASLDGSIIDPPQLSRLASTDVGTCNEDEWKSSPKKTCFAFALWVLSQIKKIIIIIWYSHHKLKRANKILSVHLKSDHAREVVKVFIFSRTDLTIYQKRNQFRFKTVTRNLVTRRLPNDYFKWIYVKYNS